MKEIEIIIDKNGKIDIEAMGFNGQGCSEVIDEFVKALGKEVKRSQKCEFYNGVNAQNKTRQRQF